MHLQDTWGQLLLEQLNITQRGDGVLATCRQARSHTSQALPASCVLVRCVVHNTVVLPAC